MKSEIDLVSMLLVNADGRAIVPVRDGNFYPTRGYPAWPDPN